ncbi:MAG: patatin-like phospholipase family protein, partial [Bacteroidales bacterium]|nr:patatin-like phospholipase family protein [Bacteroidales bacterium]
HAVRASMTYPLYFEPIMIDSNLLFDGGLYNNFPFDVLIDDFAPDYIIGSKVASVSKKPEKDDLMLQMENMIMKTTNYEIPDSVGTVIESKFENISLLDFQKADTLIMIGYLTALASIDEILERATYISDDELKEKREKFKARMPPLRFSDIYIEGVGERQKEYIVNIITKKEEIISPNQLKEEYFSLVSEENIRSAYPEAVYDSEDGTFDLLLNVELKDSYKLSAGGLISLATFNQAFIGFSNYSLSDIFNTFTGNVYLGRYY